MTNTENELKERIELQLYISYDEKYLVGGKSQIRDLQKQEIPVYSGLKDEKIYVRIYLKNDDVLKDKDIEIMCFGTGVFNEKESKKTLKFDASGRTTNYLDIPIEEAGRGWLTLQVVKLPFAPSSVDVSAKSKIQIPFNVISLEKEAKSIAEENRTVKDIAKAFDFFDFFDSEKYDKIQKAAEARNSLEFLKKRLEIVHEEHRRRALNETSPWTNTFIYFKTFGNLNYRCTENFKKYAIDYMKAAEERAWDAIKSGEDLNDFQDFLDQFCNNTVGYSCTKKNEVYKRIDELLAQWVANKGDKEKYCSFLERYKQTGFYNKKIFDKKYPNAHIYCEPVEKIDPNAVCKALIQRAKKEKNLNRLGKILADAVENNCDNRYVEEIQQKICQQNFRRATEALTIEEKISLLKEIAAEAECESTKRQAENLLNEFADLKLELITKKLTPINDPENGNRTYYKYEVLVLSGTEVEVFRINDVEDFSTVFPQIKIDKKTNEQEQTIFEFRVYDQVDADNRMVEFRTKYGKIDTIELIKVFFNLISSKIENDQLVLNFEHGRPPYWAEFIQEKNIIFRKLKNFTDTLDLTEIAKTNTGKFAVRLRDSNGSTLDLSDEVVLASSGAHIGLLWPYLLAPTFLLIGFLFYRNRS